MGVAERWLLWRSGSVLINRLRRHLSVYLTILHGVLLLLPKMPGGQQGPFSTEPAVGLSLTHGSRFDWLGLVRSKLLTQGFFGLKSAFALVT